MHTIRLMISFYSLKIFRLVDDLDIDISNFTFIQKKQNYYRTFLWETTFKSIIDEK